MFVYSKMTLLFIFLMSFVVSAQSEKINLANILVDANVLKAQGVTDGQSGIARADLNNDNLKELVEYSYSSSTPPGTCDKDDCLSSLNNDPMLTFKINFNNCNAIDVSYFCTSIGVLSEWHNGMKDLFCGPEYILRWNGESYETDDQL
jgi:hypothetical protein